MRFPELRRTFLELVAAATPLVGLGGCLAFVDPGDDTPVDPEPLPCTEAHELMTRILEPPPATQEMLVRACEADPSTCTMLCSSLLPHQDSTVLTCRVEHDPAGHDVVMTYETLTYNPGCPVPGRRPPGLARARHAGRGAASYLARAAWFEGASVHAFVGLARELHRHGAPRSLCDAARRAAADEVRHAAIMDALARSRGAAPRAVEVAPPRRRSIESIAAENAVEGVVGETWAALIATWQAHHASDAELRAAFASIAGDEARHAALAREVEAFCTSKLSQAARRRVDAARHRAITRIARGVHRAAPGLRRAAPGAMARELGLPDPAASRRLLDGARARLWA